MAKKAGLIWTDAQGERVVHVITTSTGVGAIETALQGHSQAGIIECWEGLDEFLSTAPGTGQYVTVRVTAVLEFTDGMGSSGKLFIPAPDSSIFIAGGDTVDPTAVADVIAAAVGNLICGSGNVATAFTGGWILRTRVNAITTVIP